MRQLLEHLESLEERVRLPRRGTGVPRRLRGGTPSDGIDVEGSVLHKARVYDSAQVGPKAVIMDRAEVFGDARVMNNWMRCYTRRLVDYSQLLLNRCVLAR